MTDLIRGRHNIINSNLKFSMHNITNHNYTLQVPYDQNQKSKYEDIYVVAMLTWTMTAYAFIIKTIIQSSSLSGPRYIFIGAIAIAVADCIYCVSAELKNVVSRYRSTPVTYVTAYNIIVIIKKVSFLISVLISVQLTLDQFVGIKYCLRYHEIMKKKRVAIILVCTVIFCIVPYCFKNITSFERYFQTFIVLTSIIVISIILIYNLSLAESYMKRILKDVVYLHGIQAEQYAMLRKRQKCNREVAALSVVTLFFLILSSAFFTAIGAGILTQEYIDICLHLSIAYPALNPIIYVLTLGKLKRLVKRDIYRTYTKIKQSLCGRIFRKHVLRKQIADVFISYA